VDDAVRARCEAGQWSRRRSITIAGQYYISADSASAVVFGFLHRDQFHGHHDPDSWSCGYANLSRCARLSGPAGVIGLPTNTQVWLAAGVTDMRRGMHSLAALVQTTLLSEPFSGHIFAFRGRRGDLIKLLWWSGDGLCLFIKKLERGKFVWPQTTTGTVHLTGAQLSMLLEGINWKRPERTWQPQVMV
jgi:transposase